MKKLIITSLFLLFTIPALAGQHQVVKVVDGDTIDVLYMGKKERIRLLCVDTPESVHPDQSRNTEMGRKASAYTKSRLTGKSVDLEFESKLRGKYGRLLAYVILDGKNFNVELVREGWSPYYTKYGTSEHHHVEFQQAQKYAKAQGGNVWAAQGLMQNRRKPRLRPGPIMATWRVTNSTGPGAGIMAAQNALWCFSREMKLWRLGILLVGFADRGHYTNSTK